MGKKPNILILMTDQQRADCLSCCAHPVLKTPSMDRLANEGMRFTNAFTVSPVCEPTRVSFITGLYPHNHNIWYNRGRISSDFVTLYQYLRDAGYYNAFIGKAHFVASTPKGHLSIHEKFHDLIGIDYLNETNGPRGTYLGSRYHMTDEWEEKGLLDVYKADYIDRMQDGTVVRKSALPVEDHMDSYVGRKAVEYINGYDRDQPLCMSISFPGPHEPWDAPGEYADMYDPGSIPDPISRPEDTQALAEFIRNKEDFEAEKGLDINKAKKIRANYYGKISLIDHWCGKIFNVLEDKGWMDDMLVIFISDHGEMAGDHMRIEKRTFHESGIRIPLIMRWPGRIKPGTICDSLVENIDVFDTIVELLGAEYVEESFGKSLLPLIDSPDLPHRDSVLSEIYFGGHKNFMIRTSEWKYAVDEEGRCFMLYDLRNDPDEQINLAGRADMKEKEAEMRELLFKKIIKTQLVTEKRY